MVFVSRQVICMTSCRQNTWRSSPNQMIGSSGRKYGCGLCCSAWWETAHISALLLLRYIQYHGCFSWYNIGKKKKIVEVTLFVKYLVYTIKEWLPIVYCTVKHNYNSTGVWSFFRRSMKNILKWQLVKDFGLLNKIICGLV